MYEEIDIRPYLHTLWKNRFWLIGSLFLLMIFAYIGILLIPPNYEATALVIVETDNDTIQFDSRIRSDTQNQLLGAYHELAVSDAVVIRLMDRVDTESTQTQFEKMLNAQLGNDPRLIRLKVESMDSGQAAETANVWAEELIYWTNLVYGTQSSETLTFYENELETAESNLTLANTELSEFQTINRIGIISNTLRSLYTTQNKYLDDINAFRQIADDATQFKNLLERNTLSTPVTFADRLTILSLQNRLFNSDQDTIILQLSEDSNLDLLSHDQQLALLENLTTIANEQMRIKEQSLAELEPQILILQQQLQENTSTYQQLVRDQMVAEENYLSLARKVSEERILAQNDLPPLRLISEAVVPDRPVKSNRVAVVAMAGILGFSLAAAFFLIKYWWQAENK